MPSGERADMRTTLVIGAIDPIDPTPVHQDPPYDWIERASTLRKITCECLRDDVLTSPSSTWSGSGHQLTSSASLRGNLLRKSNPVAPAG